VRAAALAAVLLGAIVLAASLGAGHARPWGAWDESARAVLLDVRLPRVLLAAVLGALLSAAGTVFQALLRNPLADPYVLGVSGGASLGGVVALLLGVGAVGVPVVSFAGALAALVAIERIATVEGRLNVVTLLLTGAIFNAFVGAAIFLIESVVSRDELHAVVLYLLGRIPSPSWGALAGTAAAGALATIPLLAMTRAYNVMSLGEEGAAQLGVDVERVKRRTFVLGSVLTALAVSASGLIGFVGLVVPHVLRRLLGPDHRVMLPSAILGGATFLVLADLAARVIVAPAELPVGVITALIGGPFFLALLRRRGSSHGAA